MNYPQLKPISRAEVEQSNNRKRAFIVQDDMERISTILAENNDENLRALHMELDGTYQPCIKSWSSGMYAFFKEYGFNYEYLDKISIIHNLTTMKGKLRGYMLQLDPEVEQRRKSIQRKEASQVAQEYSNKKVFIVHGHNEQLHGHIELLIRRIGLTPVILMNEANKGRTIIEKIEQHTDVGYGIVLYTGCDEGREKKGELRDRARQNVIFEHGYLYAKLGRGRVAALNEENIEVPSDLSGVLYIPLNDPNWKNQLMKEMQAAGLEFNPINA